MTKTPRRLFPRLDRRNAAKNIDYSPSPSHSLLTTRSLDLEDGKNNNNQTSFRIADGEIDLLFRTLGINGPEDLSIPAAAWEASRPERSSCDLLPPSPSPHNDDGYQEPPAARVCDSVEVSAQLAPPMVEEEEEEEEEEILSTSNYDDDSSISETERVFLVSPNGKFQRKIKSWMKGHLLGSGSFGKVYEGIFE